MENIVRGCVNINRVAFCHNTGDADCDDGHAVFQTGFSGYGDLAHKMEYPRWETDMHWNPDFKYIHIGEDLCLYPQWSVCKFILFTAVLCCGYDGRLTSKASIDGQCAFKPYDRNKGKVLNPYYELRWRRKELDLDAEGDPHIDYETAATWQSAPNGGGMDTDNQIASSDQTTPSSSGASDEAGASSDQNTPDASGGTEYASINQVTTTGSDKTSDQPTSIPAEGINTQDTSNDGYVPKDTVNDDSTGDGGSLNARNLYRYILSSLDDNKGGKGNPGHREFVMNAKKRAWTPVRGGVR